MTTLKEHLMLWLAILLLGCSMFGLLYGIHVYLPTQGTVVYNCTWAEISPDIPPKVKEECRKRNVERIK
jgi:hypothetical protein